ncbi:MAG: phosphate-starvation-inducible PsiE family protein [Ktedonobacterales bacterium]
MPGARRRHRTQAHYAKIPNPVRRWSLRALDYLDLLVYVVVGLSFVIAAGMALGFSLLNLANQFGLMPVSINFGQTVLNFISDLLLVLIIMEVLGTVRSYLEKGDTSVKPFLFIGIISATREILSIGARLSLAGANVVGDEFRNDMIELGVSAAIIVALAVSLKIMGAAAELPEEEAEMNSADAIAIERQADTVTVGSTR